ncbi:MAG: hypothetical protein JF595_02575 [Sphingomonadales bacterium]|nr:hypothetical protein [Sphingomonadales bacterium]
MGRRGIEEPPDAPPPRLRRAGSLTSVTSFAEDLSGNLDIVSIGKDRRKNSSLAWVRWPILTNFV